MNVIHFTIGTKKFRSALLERHNRASAGTMVFANWLIGRYCRDLACLRCAFFVAWDLVRIDLLPVEAEADASEAWVLAKDCRRPSIASVRPETCSDSRFASACCAATNRLTLCRLSSTTCTWPLAS